MDIGVLGVGRIGALHAKNLSERGGIVLADPDAARAAEVAAQVGGRVADVDDLFASVDAVVIASSTDTHAGFLRRAMEQGLPAFCEKPVSQSLDETIALAALEAERGAVVQVGFQRRWDAGYRRVRQAVETGELGVIHTVRATTLDNNPPPADYVRRSGGIFADMCIHDFDIVRYVTGREVVRAYATGGNKGPAYIAEAGDVDTVAGVLTLDDGTVVTFNGSRINRYGHDIRMEVHGETGDLAVGLDDSLTLVSAEPGATFPGGMPCQGFIDRFLTAYGTELNGFVDVVQGGGVSACTVHDGLEALRIASACAASLAQGRVVELAEIPGVPA